jgi:hypothetical protein
MEKPINNTKPPTPAPLKNAAQTKPPVIAGKGEECYSTSVLGLTGVGKTYKNIQECKTYARDNPKTGKKGRKVLILNFQNEDGYSHFKTLPPTKEAIQRFVSQKTIEIRQITPIDVDGSVMSMARKLEVMKIVLANYRNGLSLFDDVDGYAAFASSHDKDLIGTLMGLRHRGCHTMFAHQSWRKMGVTECENLRYLRIHKSLDSPEALAADKAACFDMTMCWIAYFAVEAQFDLANKWNDEGKINEAQYIKMKSYHIYVDRWKNKMFPIREENFNLAARKFLFQFPNVLKKEIERMYFEGQITAKQKNDVTVRNKAIETLSNQYKNRYLKK